MALTCIRLPTGKCHSGHNISCFNCEGVEPECTKATLKANSQKYLKDCDGGGDRCLRLWEKINDDTKKVESRCADERLCDEMKQVCVNEKKRKRENKKDPYYDCIVSCCHDDACNSADTGVNLRLYLVILCIAVGVIEALNFT